MDMQVFLGILFVTIDSLVCENQMRSYCHHISS